MCVLYNSERITAQFNRPITTENIHRYKCVCMSVHTYIAHAHMCKVIKEAKIFMHITIMTMVNIFRTLHATPLLWQVL